MDLETAIERAKNGDINAMVALANYYRKDNAELAYQYYEQAANAGSLIAKLEMAQMYNMQAAVSLRFMEQLGRDEQSISTIERAYNWALDFYNAACSEESLSRNTMNEALNVLVLATSRLATICFLDDRHSDMINLAKNIDHPYVHVVHGYAMYQLSETDSEIEKAAMLLKEIENESCWEKEYQTKFGQLILLQASSILSTIYRVLYHDTDSAYRVLETASRYIINEEFRNDLKDDLSHYRKKLFGGYVYVE